MAGKAETPEQQRARYASNPGPYKAAMREYYAANAGRVKARTRAYYAEHRDEILAAKRRAYRSAPAGAPAAGDALPVREAGPASAAERAAAGLIADPARSNRLIAAGAGCSERVVRRVRDELEASGTIPDAPVRVPRARPGPAAGSAAALRAGRRPPPVIELPPAPDWSKGLCTQVKPSMRSWWTSSDRDEREAAARMCQCCPVLAGCEQWSLALPWSDRDAVYGGMSPAERQRRKRQVRLEMAGTHWPP
jgi:hypothetical protein